MAYHGPSYGLSRECQLKTKLLTTTVKRHGFIVVGIEFSRLEWEEQNWTLAKAQAKFSMDRAMSGLRWIEAMLEHPLEPPKPDEGFRDQLDVAYVLKDGVALCQLINMLEPGLIKKVNTMKAPFKQRENVEMFLKGCESYGLKSQDLFQVNDLYEHKNLYMVVDCLFALGGLAQKKGFDGPQLGVKVADENKRLFSQEQLSESQRIIGLQYGTNKGASQAGMTAYGTTRQILPDATLP